jgi:Tfp pilus assembly protein PilN
MRLTINLASEPVGLLKRIRLALVAVAAGLAVLLVSAVVDTAADRRQVDEERVRSAELSELRRLAEEQLARDGLALTEEGRVALAAQVAVANQMLQQRRFSWSGVLSALERAIPAGVSLTSIQPQPATRMLTLKGDALSLSQLTRLVMKLEESPAFGDVFLADQRGRPDDSVSFTLHVRY